MGAADEWKWVAIRLMGRSGDLDSALANADQAMQRIQTAATTDTYCSIIFTLAVIIYLLSIRFRLGYLSMFLVVGFSVLPLLF